MFHFGLKCFLSWLSLQQLINHRHLYNPPEITHSLDKFRGKVTRENKSESELKAVLYLTCCLFLTLKTPKNPTPPPNNTTRRKRISLRHEFFIERGAPHTQLITSAKNSMPKNILYEKNLNLFFLALSQSISRVMHCFPLLMLSSPTNQLDIAKSKPIFQVISMTCVQSLTTQ